MSPCFMCIEKSCHDCPCAIADTIDGVLQETNLIKVARLNINDYRAFAIRLRVELDEAKNRKIQNWRGFSMRRPDEMANVRIATGN